MSVEATKKALLIGAPRQPVGWVVLVKAPNGDVASVLGPQSSQWEARVATEILRLSGGYTTEVRPLREVEAHDVHGDPPNPRDADLLAEDRQ
jgi:hypothetical protein